MSNGEALVVAMWEGIFEWALRKQRIESKSPAAEESERDDSRNDEAAGN
jgi:hypothetical protein